MADLVSFFRFDLTLLPTNYSNLLTRMLKLELDRCTAGDRSRFQVRNIGRLLDVAQLVKTGQLFYYAFRWR